MSADLLLFPCSALASAETELTIGTCPQLPLIDKEPDGSNSKSKYVMGRRNWCSIVRDATNGDLIFDIRIEKQKGIGETVGCVIARVVWVSDACSCFLFRVVTVRGRRLRDGRHGKPVDESNQPLSFLLPSCMDLSLIFFCCPKRPTVIDCTHFRRLCTVS